VKNFDSPVLSHENLLFEESKKQKYKKKDAVQTYKKPKEEKRPDKNNEMQKKLFYERKRLEA